MGSGGRAGSLEGSLITSSQLDKGQIQGHGKPNMKLTSNVARDLSRSEKGEITLLLEIYTEMQGQTVYSCHLEAVLSQGKRERKCSQRGQYKVLYCSVLQSTGGRR